MSEPLPCPACRAANEQGPRCRRCKADLSSLFDLAAQRARVLAAAYHEAGLGRWGRALGLALGAEALRGGDDARRLIATAHLMRRDFRSAWEWYSRRPG